MKYKFLDYTGLEHVIEAIKNQFVQKVTGKDLSTNDFTEANKTKLDGIETGAQVNIVNKVNNKTGDIILNSDDILFTSSKSGSTPTTTRAIIDSILDKDIAQDAANAQVTNRVSDLETDKANVSYVDTEVGKKVDKVTGKGLSANDFTTTLKDKLDGIDSGAQTNVIEIIKRNGTNLTVTGKAVDISVPTKLSDLTNDRTFQTEAQIKSLIAEHGRLKKEIVATLPDIAEADDNTMYLVASDNGFSEWMVIDGQWEKLGDTSDIDLTQYVKKTDLVPITAAEIDAMWIA